MMEKEQTNPISARFPFSLFIEMQKELRETNQNMSEYIIEAVKDKLFSESSPELLDKEIAYHESIVNNLKKKKEHHKEKKTTLLKIPKGEISFLIETQKLLEENPTFCEGRISLYKNKFGKHYRISPNDFFELCAKAEDQFKEKQTMKEIEAR